MLKHYIHIADARNIVPLHCSKEFGNIGNSDAKGWRQHRIVSLAPLNSKGFAMIFDCFILSC